MAPPPIQIFLTTIASQHALRQRQEYLLRILQVKKVPFTSYDLASDEDAKKLWKRKAPLSQQQLPGILVGGEFAGSFTDFEEAVEHGELDIFFRRNENYMPFADDPPPAEQQPIGVPGVATPLQMVPERLKLHVLATPAPSPNTAASIPVNKRQGEGDVGEELSGFGLQGVKVTQDELKELVEELGLEGDEAGDLVKGLSAPVGSQGT